MRALVNTNKAETSELIKMFDSKLLESFLLNLLLFREAAVSIPHIRNCDTKVSCSRKRLLMDRAYLSEVISMAVTCAEMATRSGRRRR